MTMTAKKKEKKNKKLPSCNPQRYNQLSVLKMHHIETKSYMFHHSSLFTSFYVHCFLSGTSLQVLSLQGVSHLTLTAKYT
jgi:hypothetical protein